MGHTRQSLAHDLAALGLKAGDIVMVHASCRAVGKVFGGPDEIHLAILDAVGLSGTMMMVVAVPEGVDEVGRGRLTPEEEAALIEKQPPYDPETARADREIGTLAEFFRSWPGTVCSRAVARFAARGERATWLVTDQPWNYPFGHGSPLEKLVQSKGKVLLLGCDHDTVTLMHYVEHVTDFPGKVIASCRVPVLRDGKRQWVSYLEVNSSSEGAHANWPDRFFALITDAFITEHEGTELCRSGKVGNADAFLIDAAALVAYATPVMVQCARGTT